ncbi:hypothetical protein DFJ58DRAFT_736731 [Suillus subalutaceus]|uniref:uncharacterized protein n=1 Tax=Suillus subalutaceus TaxID=48586 RepID=UPI001B87F972|nr:uncharacterized protein DFJ58DRAFT_736731 [Suillus subalutaceus]KAG1831173.1 hypothetical protein DFJ58DRAFT_736731 [Suillus subalutaceus]
MNTPVDSFGMPLRTCSAAPRFGGDYTQLVNFLESVERLAQPLGLSDKDIIKYALKYTAPNERELFQYYKGNNYEEFANSALFMYPECGIERRYTRPTSAQSTIPLPPLEAHHEAPLVGAPQQPERALDQPAVAVMAPSTTKHAKPFPFRLLQHRLQWLKNCPHVLTFFTIYDIVMASGLLFEPYTVGIGGDMVEI